MMNLITKALGLFGIGNPAVSGPVVSGKKEGENTLSYIPYSKTAESNPVIATEGFAMPRTGALIQSPFNINGITPENRVWLSMYNAGTAHRDAPATLESASQYILIGGREYGVGTYRGIGLGYVSALSDIAPVFVGIQEVGPDDHTNANFIVATRASQKNVAPDVRFTVKTDGQIQASEGYTPKSAQSLVNKQYLDTIVDELQAQIDALKKGV